MAKTTALELSIKIAGKVDSSLTGAIATATKQVSGLSTTLSAIGKAGLASMTALAVGGVAAIKDITEAAEELENQMGDVARYVNGLVTWTQDANGNQIATYTDQYQQMKDAIQQLSTEIPLTTEELTAMAAAAGQSGKTFEDLIPGGFLRDTAMMATAMDVSAEQAGNWAAKWEKAFNTNHEEIMELADQINYLGANTPTTAAEIAQVVNDTASLGQVAGMTTASTAALADAFLAMGVDTGKATTSINRMLTNLSLGDSATKKQEEMWESLGFTASEVAKSMQTDSVGTLRQVFASIKNLSDDKQVAALKTLFGQWAIEGTAKLTGNWDVLETALAMVRDSSLYNGSMEREFIINASTPESVDTMLSNAVTALKQDAGEAFLPVKKEAALLAIDVLNGIRDNLPDLTNLAQSVMPLIRTAVEKTGTALETAMPYVQTIIDYLTNNGEKVAKIIAGIAATFAGMTLAPQIEKLLLGGGKGSGLISTLSTVGNSLLGIGGKAAGTAGGLWTAATTGIQLANSSITTQNGGSTGGGILSKISNGALGAFYGIKNSDVINGTGNNKSWFKGIMGVADQITNAKKTGGVFANISKATGLTDYMKGFTINSPADVFGSFSQGLISGANTAMATGGSPFSMIATVLGGGAKGLFGSGGLNAIGNIGNMLSPAISIFGSLFTSLAPVILAISTVIALFSILGDHMDGLRDIIQNTFGDTGVAVFDGFVAKLQGIGDFITGLFADGGVAAALEPLRNIVGNLFGDTGTTAFDGLTTILQSIMGVVGQVVDFAINTVKPAILEVWNFLGTTVVPGLVNIFSASAPYIGQIISSLGTAIMGAMSMIASAIQAIWPIVQIVIEAVIGALTVAVPAVLGYFSGLFSSLSGIITSIQGIFDGLIQFITGVFTGNWQQAWDGVKEIFGSAFDALIELCKVPINAVIGLIDGAIDGINSILGSVTTIPEWVPIVGGQTFSMQLPTMPMLANGGMTNGVSIAGEAGQEAVISFKSSQRARNIALWEQAGKLLGADNELQDVTGGAGNGQSGDQSIAGATIMYSPNIVIQGNADKNDVAAALAEGYEQFRGFMARYSREQRRTVY